MKAGKHDEWARDAGDRPFVHLEYARLRAGGIEDSIALGSVINYPT